MGARLEHDVPEHLHKGAPQAKHQERSEVRVPGHAQDRLPALRNHFLHQHALDHGPGVGPGHGRQDLAVSSPDFIAVGQIQLHPAHVEFVDNVRGDDFQDHRIAQVRRGPDRLVLTVGPDKGDHREAVGLEDLVGLGFQDEFPAGRLDAVQHLFHSVTIDVGKGFHLIPVPVNIGGIASHGPQAPDRLFREVVVGELGFGPDGQGFFDFPQGHLADQGGFVVRRRHLRHRGGDGGQVRHELRGGDDDDPIDVVVSQNALQGGAVAVLPGVPQDIHRVVDVGRGRQPGLEPGHGLR